VSARVTVVGSIGGPGYGLVDPVGGLTAAGADWSIGWCVGADDGWHAPAVGRQRLESPGVVETRLKVPSGDAVQRVYGVGGAGDIVVVEIVNDSPLPFGVGFLLRGDPSILWPREPFPLDEPLGACDAAVQLPVAHRTSTRIAVALDPHAVDPGATVARLATAEDVARGWRAVLDAGMRVDLPDGSLMAALDAARSCLLLHDDGVAIAVEPGERAADPVAAATMVVAMERWGFNRHAAELRPAIPRRAFKRVGRPDPTLAMRPAPGDALSAAEFLLRARDMVISEVEGGVAVLPVMPEAWRGGPIEVHDARAGGARVSYAIRWHDDRPALLWTVEGGPLRLSAPGLDRGWSTTDPSGETLLAGPS